MQFLTNSDLSELVDWRRRLHLAPEISGEEENTAREVADALRALGPGQPGQIVTGLGGHGVAAVFEGAALGPTVLFRAELDGLAIEDKADVPHRSRIPGRGHLCGHDGHMAILMALARGLSRRRPARGRAILLFQPAEEDGSGAAAILADPRWRELRPDYAFALHNLPGLAHGRVALAAGPVNCASRGMVVALAGSTAHASMPETGVSPAPALAALLQRLARLGESEPPDPRFAAATVTHVEMGERVFGIAPGRAELWLTLRTLLDERMDALVEAAEGIAREEAAAAGLGLEIAYADVFAHCENDPRAVAVMAAALDAEGVAHDEAALPIRASEDFGRFGKEGTHSAMFFLGAGEDHPQLHTPQYDFPDDLIAIGARVFMRSLRDLLG